MFGLYSTPSARAPRLAAPITFRPSPDPRSITKSCGRDRGQVEHPLDELRRRRHPHDILAGLADLRDEWFVLGAGGGRKR